jgi:eukaryotic-like serine/threonine-protein kinase
MPLSAGTRVGAYEIVCAIGAGGMGEVYRARDPRLGRDVAIKVVSAAFGTAPDRVRRFEQEARAAAALNHPNICTIHDVGHDGAVAYIAMELLEGETLQDRLSRGPLPIGEWLDLATALADAVGAAHRAGTLHRDLKPANIFLTSRGPKVLDFGLAKSTASAAPHASHDATLPREAAITDAGTTVGTIGYMSPEQLRGEPLDARSDLFSLGLVLYEAATGRPAFTGATSAVISAGILHTAPIPPRQFRSDLPARLEDVLLKALERERVPAGDLTRRQVRGVRSGGGRRHQPVDSTDGDVEQHAHRADRPGRDDLWSDGHSGRQLRGFRSRQQRPALALARALPRRRSETDRGCCRHTRRMVTRRAAHGLRAQ